MSEETKPLSEEAVKEQIEKNRLYTELFSSENDLTQAEIINIRLHEDLKREHVKQASKKK